MKIGAIKKGCDLMAIIKDAEFGMIETDEPIPPKIDYQTYKSEENKKKHIDEYYNGDKEKYCAQTKVNNLKITFWNELVEYDNIFPEHKKRAEHLIQTMLGYIPPDTGNYFYHEVEIRKAINSFNVEKYSEEKHFDEVYAIVTELRNADMKKEDFGREYGEREMIGYTSYTLIPYSQIARDRLAKNLGYYPDLRYSLEAEILLRYHLSDDSLIPENKMMNFDFRSMTIVKYREVLLNEGLEAADRSPLVGFQRIVEKTVENTA